MKPRVEINFTIYVLIHTHNGVIYNTEISIDKEEIDNREDGIYLTFGEQITPKQNVLSAYTQNPHGKYHEIDGKFYILPSEDRLEIHSRLVEETLIK